MPNSFTSHTDHRSLVLSPHTDEPEEERLSSLSLATHLARSVAHSCAQGTPSLLTPLAAGMFSPTPRLQVQTDLLPRPRSNLAYLSQEIFYN